MGTKRTTVEHSSVSPKCSKKSGTRLQLSGQGAAVRSTETEKVCFGGVELELNKETVGVLMCLLSGYMSQVYNGDLMALSFYAAKDFSEKMGISEEKFVEVANIIHKELNSKRKKHPFISSGFMA